jgi:hypothetical protein
MVPSRVNLQVSEEEKTKAKEAKELSHIFLCSVIVLFLVNFEDGMDVRMVWISPHGS